MSTYNLCFRAEIRKPQFYYIKVGFKGGQIYIGMFLWWLDDNSGIIFLFNSMKTYVVCTHYKWLIEMLLISTHILHFMEK